MRDPMHDLARRLHDERGASAVEYAFLASLIAVVIIAAVTTLGVNVRGLLESVPEIFPL